MQMKQNSPPAPPVAPNPTLIPAQGAEGSSAANSTPDAAGEQAAPVATASLSNAQQTDAVAHGTQNLEGSTAHLNHPAKHPWEHVDDVVAILKTAYPLLALTLETMVDQINQRFRATSEEEIYRYTFMLLQDGVGVSVYTYCLNSSNGVLDIWLPLAKPWR